MPRLRMAVRNWRRRTSPRPVPRNAGETASWTMFTDLPSITPQTIPASSPDGVSAIRSGEEAAPRGQTLALLLVALLQGGRRLGGEELEEGVAVELVARPLPPPPSQVKEKSLITQLLGLLGLHGELRQAARLAVGVVPADDHAAEPPLLVGEPQLLDLLVLLQRVLERAEHSLAHGEGAGELLAVGGVVQRGDEALHQVEAFRRAPARQADVLLLGAPPAGRRSPRAHRSPRPPRTVPSGPPWRRRSCRSSAP